MPSSFRNLIVSSFIGLVGFLTVLFTVYPLAAQEDAASFYAGKRLTLYVGYAPGGGFDINARLVGRHLRAFIPGNPRIIVKNKPGAGGMVLANYLYNIASPDGLEIGTVGRTGPLSELLGRPGIHFNAQEFTWIGSPSSTVSALFIRADLGIKTIADLKAAKKKVIFPGLRPDSTNVTVPRFFAEYFDWPVRAIPGYRGTGEMLAALERKEGEAIWNNIESVMGNRPDLVEKGFLIPIMQTGPYFPSVPLLSEVMDMPPGVVVATYDFLAAPELWGVSLAGPPRMPEERAKVLRHAFMRMARSERFTKDAKRLGMSGEPLSGEEVEKLIRKVFEQVKANPEVIQIVEKLSTGK